MSASTWGWARRRDCKYLLMEAGSHTTSEWRFLSATLLKGSFA